jgi:hypothetical protein
MTTEYPMNFLAQNVKIIDYYNIRAGFIFDVNCNYTEAATVGEVVFDSITFAEEEEHYGKLRLGSFIYYASPANLTIKNSVLRYHHNVLENIHVIDIEDKSTCSFNDDIIQHIMFKNNSISYDEEGEEEYNDFYLYFSGADQRRKDIEVIGNTLTNMTNSLKSFFDVENYSPGTILFENNYIRN